MSKKKNKAFIFWIAVFVLSVTVGSILAYLADKDHIRNEIPIGFDQTEIVEKYEPPEKLEKGVSFPKKVQIKNTGAVPCYVRVKALFTDETVLEYTTLDYNTTDWAYDSTDGYWYYKNPLPVGDLTTPVFTTVSIADDVEDSEIKDFEILVYHESYQQGEYTDYVSAWKNYRKNQAEDAIVGVRLTTQGDYTEAAGRQVGIYAPINKDGLKCYASYRSGHETVLGSDEFSITPDTAPAELGEFDVTASYTDSNGSTFNSNAITFEAIKMLSWTATSNGTYFFTQDGDTWKSNNQGKHRTSAKTTWTLKVPEEAGEITYTLSYRVSSESGWDKLTITLDGTSVVTNTSGAGYLTNKVVTLAPGTHTIVATYSKDSSGNRYEDTGYIVLKDIFY